MAITTNTWNLITFKPFSDPAWTGLLNPPTLQQAFMRAILAGDPLMGFVLADGDPFTFLVVGGLATLPAAVVDSESTQTSVTITNSIGARSDLARSPDGALLYWRTGQQIWTYDAAAITDLNSITS